MNVDVALADLAREHSGRVLAILAAKVGLDVADDAVQDALVEAARTWPRSGVPGNPPGWLMTVARRKAIDRQRRASSSRRQLSAAAAQLVAADAERDAPDRNESTMIDDTFADAGTDEQLRLMLLCCHPALDPDAQVALTLRLVGGLSTPEIAAAYLVPEATLAQRIVRAKRKIRDAAIPLSLPAQLDDRLDTVLSVLYLIFNEGYLARATSDEMVRIDLAEQAIRLTRLVGLTPTGSAEPEGLLALELFHHARATSRLDDAGDLVLLDDQDRSQWDRTLIRDANRIVQSMMGKRRPGPYQVQALIAAMHANARTAADTDWPRIAALYGQLSAMTPSPIVSLNHAVAIAMADGPLAGLALVDRLTDLHTYYLWHSTRAELLLREGRRTEAHEAFLEARRLALNPAEQRHLDRRVAATV